MNDEELDILNNEEDIEELEKAELLNDYQVVRREFFAHMHEAAVTFRYEGLSFNSAAINKMVGVETVHVLINSKKKKMIIKACDAEAKNAAKWCKFDKKKEKWVSRRLSARMFCAKLYDMLGWNPLNRYKIQGTVMKCEEEIILVFNLEDTEIFIPRKKDDGDATKSNRSYFPEGWRESFGITYGELKKSIGVEILDDFVAMEVVKKKDRTPKSPRGFSLVETPPEKDDGKK